MRTIAAKVTEEYAPSVMRNLKRKKNSRNIWEMFTLVIENARNVILPSDRQKRFTITWGLAKLCGLKEFKLNLNNFFCRAHQQKNSYMCDICSKVFHKPTLLKSHREMHTRVFDKSRCLLTVIVIQLIFTALWMWCLRNHFNH